MDDHFIVPSALCVEQFAAHTQQQSSDSSRYLLHKKKTQISFKAFAFAQRKSRKLYMYKQWAIPDEFCTPPHGRYVQIGNFQMEIKSISRSAFNRVLLGHEFWLSFSPKISEVLGGGGRIHLE